MARRNGRKGDYLFTDYYSGTTKYASRMRKDYWNSYGEKILERNLQEIATPLNDPYPVPIFSGPQYEQVNPCVIENVPIYIGNTNVFTPYQVNAPVSAQAYFIPEMSIGCSFTVF